MIFLLLDYLLSLISPYKTYFILINLVILPKNKFFNLILIGLFLDLLILNTYFLNTIILSIIFLIVKKLGINKKDFKSYIISLIFIYISYILIIGFINGYTINYLLKFILNTFLINFIFYILCYNLKLKNIKLAR